MQEDFLHYVWKHKKMQLHRLKTTTGSQIVIASVGHHNLNAGPDFFNAQLSIGEQSWAGNVEIHVKSSDWYLHNHERDKAYDSVILHVVWEHDTEVFRKGDATIDTLQLSDFIDRDVLGNYQKLFSKQNRWIYCEDHFRSIKDFVMRHWLERLYFERLEQKTQAIWQLLKDSKNDWEAVLFRLLAKNFGLKVNGTPFYSMAQSIGFPIVRKLCGNQQQLEALFLGQSRLLDRSVEEPYYRCLKEEYLFLKRKFALENAHVVPAQFFRLRPVSFPTIRLSQLATLYCTRQNLFSKVIETSSLNDFYTLFKVATAPFWETHYTFQKASRASVKFLSRAFVDLLLINTILPIKFCYAKQRGEAADVVVSEIATGIDPEKNHIVEAFGKLRMPSQSSLESQALIQLKTQYCDNKKCLQCAVGHYIIGKR